MGRACRTAIPWGICSKGGRISPFCLDKVAALYSVVGNCSLRLWSCGEDGECVAGVAREARAACLAWALKVGECIEIKSVSRSPRTAGMSQLRLLSKILQAVPGLLGRFVRLAPCASEMFAPGGLRDSRLWGERLTARCPHSRWAETVVK